MAHACEGAAEDAGVKGGSTRLRCWEPKPSTLEVLSNLGSLSSCPMPFLNLPS